LTKADLSDQQDTLATTSVSQELRAFTVHAPTMDMLDDHGFAKDLMA
jgi:hypothetical protein